MLFRNLFLLAILGITGAKAYAAPLDFDYDGRVAEHCLVSDDQEVCLLQIVAADGSSRFVARYQDQPLLLLDDGVARLNADIEDISDDDYEVLANSSLLFAYDRRTEQNATDQRIDCDDGHCGVAITGGALGGGLGGAAAGHTVGGPIGAAIGAAAGAISGGIAAYETSASCRRGCGDHDRRGGSGSGSGSGGGNSKKSGGPSVNRRSRD